LLSIGQEHKSRAIIQVALDAFDKVKAKAPNDQQWSEIIRHIEAEQLGFDSGKTKQGYGKV